jgi:hypothetical protein
MKKITHTVFLLLCLIYLQGCSAYTELEVHGPTEEKLDILLVPSHFYSPDAGGNPKWVADAEAVRKKLLEHPFWSKYRDKVNVYRLNSSTADDFKASDGVHWVPDREWIKEFAHVNFPALEFHQNDQIIFVIESDAYQKDPIYFTGNTRGEPNIVTLETGHIESLVHEFGHAFGGLGDEYAFGLSIENWVSDYPNIATLQTGDRCEDRWNDLMNVVILAPGTDYEGELQRGERMTGCFLATYPESKTKGFRPVSFTCIMNQIDDKYPFCPVCQRQLVTLLNKYTPFDDNKLYDKGGTYQEPAKFMEASQNLSVINFDQSVAFDAKTGKPIDASKPVTDVVAPAPGKLAGEIYADAGVHFTSGVILKQPFGNAPPTWPNVLSTTPINPKEHALVAGYFLSKRICAIGIYNTGISGVTLSTYNAAFIKTGIATIDSNVGNNTFIGLRTTEPIYRFEIGAASATGPLKATEFAVDNLYFGECPK